MPEGESSRGEELFEGGYDPAIETRRWRVLELTVMGYTQTEIARALGVGQPTISNDLAWIAKRRKALFGSPSKLSAEEEIGSAYDFFTNVEQRSLRAAVKSQDAKAQNAYFRTAILARNQRIALLQDIGKLDRELGTVGLTLRADQLRQALRDEGLLAGPKALLDVNPTEEDDVERWLRKEAS